MSHSACPHCGSTNSIETAGQRYCADCGQLIMSKKPEPKEDKKAAVKAEKKTEKKPEPKAKAVSQKAPAAKPRQVAPPLNLKAIEESRHPKASAPHKAGVLDLKSKQPKPAIKKPVGKHVPPAAPVAEVKLQPEFEAFIAEAEIAEAELSQVRVPVIGKKFYHKQALRDAFKSIVSHRTFRVAFIAALITTICETIFVVKFATTGLYAITESINAASVNPARMTTLVGHVAWAALLGFVGYLAYHYAEAMIIFRTSRSFDRRSSSVDQSRKAALGSLAGMFGVDVITWIFALLSLILVTGANVGFLGTKSLGVSGLALAAITNAIVVYVWLGLIAARHMATYAIVLGQVGVRRAYATGWSLYNRQFGRVTTALLIVVAVSFIIALPASLLQNALGGSSTTSLLVATLVTGLTQAVIMIVGSVYFLRLYRFVIAREYDSELGHLLSGRQPQQSHVGRRLAVLSIIAVIWVAVMTGLIIYSSPVASALVR